MKTYRIHCVDENDEIVVTHDFVCHDDLAALEKAKELCTNYGIEVWDNERRVTWLHRRGEVRYGYSARRPTPEDILIAIAPPHSKSARNQMTKERFRRAGAGSK